MDNTQSFSTTDVLCKVMPSIIISQLLAGHPSSINIKTIITNCSPYTIMLSELQPPTFTTTKYLQIAILYTVYVNEYKLILSMPLLHHKYDNNKTICVHYSSLQLIFLNYCSTIAVIHVTLNYLNTQNCLTSYLCEYKSYICIQQQS